MRVLFCIENYKHGGIPMALNSLLSQMRGDDGISKEVFCLNQEDGPYKPLLEKYVVNKPNRLIWAFSTYYTQHHLCKRHTAACLPRRDATRTANGQRLSGKRVGTISYR